MDNNTFLAAYNTYAPALRRRAQTRLNGVYGNDVDDLIQQVFVELHKQEGIIDVRRFLYTCLRRRIADYVKTQRRQRRTAAREVQVELSSHADPSSPVELKEIAARLRSLVAMLPEHERLCVEQVMLGRSCNEYAEMVNKPVANIKRWTRHGLARLRCQFED
jgi:RNA polymerase sigma factor (sigma-70 family)